MKKIFEILKKNLLFILVIMLILTARVTNIFRINVVSGHSMFPTLVDKQIVLGSSLGKLDRYDIVVAEHDNTLVVKRLIGLPGDTVEYRDNKIYIDGELIEEPYANPEERNCSENWEYKLGEDQYLIMGDNRNHSYDSRDYGPISRKEIQQIVFFGAPKYEG